MQQVPSWCLKKQKNLGDVFAFGCRIFSGASSRGISFLTKQLSKRDFPQHETSKVPTKDQSVQFFHDADIPPHVRFVEEQL